MTVSRDYLIAFALLIDDCSKLHIPFADVLSIAVTDQTFNAAVAELLSRVKVARDRLAKTKTKRLN